MATEDSCGCQYLSPPHHVSPAPLRKTPCAPLEQQSASTLHPGSILPGPPSCKPIPTHNQARAHTRTRTNTEEIEKGRARDEQELHTLDADAARAAMRSRSVIPPPPPFNPCPRTHSPTTRLPAKHSRSPRRQKALLLSPWSACRAHDRLERLPLLKARHRPPREHPPRPHPWQPARPRRPSTAAPHPACA